MSKKLSVTHLDLMLVVVLARHLELVACCATDGCFHKGLLEVNVKAASANITRAAIGEASALRSSVHEKDHMSLVSTHALMGIILRMITRAGNSAIFLMMKMRSLTIPL